jgi:hypothetical protein
MGMAAATLGFTGAGAASLDAVLDHGDGSLEADLFTLALGLLTGCFVLLGRDTPDPGPIRCQRGSHETGWPPDVASTHEPVTSSKRRAGIARRHGIVTQRYAASTTTRQGLLAILMPRGQSRSTRTRRGSVRRADGDDLDVELSGGGLEGHHVSGGVAE